MWCVSCRGAITIKKREVSEKGRWRRVETWGGQDWKGTNGKLLGLVGWGSPNKSFAVAGIGLSVSF